MVVDETHRPMRIPPIYGTYAEEKGIFDILKMMLEKLIIDRPSDPLQYMINWLDQDNGDLPAVVIQGAFASGRHSIGKQLSQKMRCAYLCKESLIAEDTSDAGTSARNLAAANKPIPDETMIKLIQNRLEFYDAKKKGWVMVGFPETREQAHKLQTSGILAKHFILLECPDEVTLDRARGKRIDPQTGDIYNTTFFPPLDPEVEARLELGPGSGDDGYVMDQLLEYHRHISGLLNCYQYCLQRVNADQPLTDVSNQVMSLVSQRARTAAPHTPRVMLLGPPGAGKAVQADLLAKKYSIVHVDIDHLTKTHIADETTDGLAIKKYVDKGADIPDYSLIKILEARLSCLDCVSRGWILTGYPASVSQAEELERRDLKPNRVFWMDIPDESIVERLCNRFTDPLTGERYHTIYNPPPSKEVKDRLQQHPADREEAVRGRLNRYLANKDELGDWYDDVAQVINADQDPHTVFELLESLIVNPL